MFPVLLYHLSGVGSGVRVTRGRNMAQITYSNHGHETVGPPCRIPPQLRLWAAERLVSAGNRRQAAQRLIESAPTHGIDLDLMWGTLAPDQRVDRCRVRQVCLAVLGSGRTAMLFLSSPDLSKLYAPLLGSRATQIGEISGSISAALDGLRDLAPERVTLAQALVEPRHDWSREACLGAGMTCVGQLDYMRKKLTKADLTPMTEPAWPQGVSVRPITTLDPQAPGSDRANLIAALEGTYADTLDCPELCGLRSMPDVIESHKGTGDYDPSRWLLVFRDGEPAGCCLLTHCPLSSAIELVYLGLTPSVRGLGLGKRLLAYGISRFSDKRVREITCAVDNRNAPAIGIYESLDFARFDARVGFVASITRRE